MAEETRAGSDRSRRVDEAMAEYLKAADAGRGSDPAAFAARHPELAPELGRALADFGLIEGLGAPVGPDPASASTVGLEDLPVPPSPPSDQIRPGGLVGDYELIRPIARGGMGVVWEARNTKNRLNLPVALKMIRAGEAASEADI
ncbi:MAG: hypothetical protein U0800_26320, partial [Isosphaeraceae bacterium]